MKKRMMFIKFFILTMIFGNSCVFSDPIKSPVLPQHVTIKNKIYAYLKGVRFFSCSFSQTNPNGSVVLGRLWLDRQDQRVRIDYFSESESLQKIIPIQGYRGSLTLVDHRTHNESSYNVSGTPAELLLSRDFSLKDFPIKKTEQDHDQNLFVTFESQGKEIILTFSLYDNGNIQKLLGWTIREYTDDAPTDRKEKSQSYKDTHVRFSQDIRVNDPSELSRVFLPCS